MQKSDRSMILRLNWRLAAVLVVLAAAFGVVACDQRGPHADANTATSAPAATLRRLRNPATTMAPEP